MLYVLPTASLVRQFKEFERLFCFYEEGIKGVIRDTILLSSAWVLYRSMCLNRHQERPPTADGLLEKILRDYTNSPEAIMRHYTENTSEEAYVEMIAEVIDREVGEMLLPLFQSEIYDVSKTEWHWVGDDLIVRIKIYPR